MKIVEGYLGSDILIEGSLFSKQGTRIDGTCVGTITCESNVDVGASAVVRGTIHGETVQVSGHIEGEVLASQRLTVLRQAQVKGTLITRPGGLSMDNGGRFEGGFVMRDVPTPKEEDPEA